MRSTALMVPDREPSRRRAHKSKKVFKNRKYFTLLSNLLPAVRPQSANNIGTPVLSVSSKVSYTNRSHLGVAEMDIRVINLGTY
jgi:hypothetical protein